jgi:hypothetical protein
MIHASSTANNKLDLLDPLRQMTNDFLTREQFIASVLWYPLPGGTVHCFTCLRTHEEKFLLNAVSTANGMKPTTLPICLACQRVLFIAPH